jgi:hypothetical protein
MGDAGKFYFTDYVDRPILFRCLWLKNIDAHHITIRLNKYSAPCKKNSWL